MQTLLSVQNLSKAFKGFAAVDGVSFNANAGEIFGLLGPNGAGKTTTIRVISTVLEATGGTAEVAGFDITKQPEDVRRNVGILTADIGLYDRFTARENLRYFGQLYGMEGEKLEQRIDELIQILDMKSYADRRAGKFSTGMKQKVAIARSIIHDPKVIIFDEPTAGLDVLASQTVVSFMKKAREMGKLVVLSTHNMHDAEKLSDRVAIIHKGKLVAQGSVSEVLASAGAQSLEDAFMRIVKEKKIEGDVDNAVGKKDISKKPADKKKQGTIIRLAGFAVIIIGFGTQMAELFGEAGRTIGVGLILIGALMTIAGKYVHKKYTRNV